MVNGREVVIPNTFQYTDSNPQGIFQLFIAPIKGFTEAALIIGFILIVGGAFNVLQKTDAINAFINKLARAYDKSKLLRSLFVPVLLTLFSIAVQRLE